MATRKTSTKAKPKRPTRAKTTAAASRTKKPTARKKVTAARVATKKQAGPSLGRLRGLNIAAAAVNFLQAIVILVLSNGATLPVTTQYMTTDSLVSSGEESVLVPAFRDILDVNLGYLVAAFLVISAIVHVLVATVYRKQYEAGIAAGVSRARWYGYSLSASTMLVTVSMLVGIYDMSSLMMIFGLVAVASLSGLLIETRSLGTRRILMLIGLIAAVLPLIAIKSYALHTHLYGDAAFPSYVYAVLGTIALALIAMAANFWLHYKRVGKWSNYAFTEMVCIVLGTSVKAVVAWLIFSGALY